MYRPIEDRVSGEDEKVLQKINQEQVRSVIWQRHMTNFLSGWARALNWGKARYFEYQVQEGRVSDLEDYLWEYFESWKTKTPDLNYWLACDVSILVRTFLVATSSSSASLKIFPILSDSENYFRESESKFKLLCSYAGLGIEWSQTP